MNIAARATWAPGPGSRQGSACRPCSTAQAHQLVPGRVELDLVDAVAEAVVGAQDRLRSRSPRTPQRIDLAASPPAPRPPGPRSRAQPAPSRSSASTSGRSCSPRCSPPAAATGSAPRGYLDARACSDDLPCRSWRIGACPATRHRGTSIAAPSTRKGVTDMAHEVTLIPATAPGPELIEATRRVLEATGVEFEWDEHPAGEDVYARGGDARSPTARWSRSSATRSGSRARPRRRWARASARSTCCCARSSTSTPASGPASPTRACAPASPRPTS